MKYKEKSKDKPEYLSESTFTITVLHNNRRAMKTLNYDRLKIYF
jgi:hypothetical protein